MEVVNVKKEKYTVYIGRGSVFGNPFVLGRDGNREEVIDKYCKWLAEPGQEHILRAIYRLPHDAVLGCYCKPLACHGDVIATLNNTMHACKELIEEHGIEKVRSIIEDIRKEYKEV